LSHHPVRARFWIEVVCGTAGLFLLALTLVSHEWIELIFGVDPDGGSGAVEVALPLALLAIVAASSRMAIHEWRRGVAA